MMGGEGQGGNCSFSEGVSFILILYVVTISNYLKHSPLAINIQVQQEQQMNKTLAVLQWRISKMQQEDRAVRWAYHWSLVVNLGASGGTSVILLAALA